MLSSTPRPGGLDGCDLIKELIAVIFKVTSFVH